MVPLVTMVKYGRSECLSHPLCEVLLQRKWNKYGLPLYGITTFLYLIYLSCLTRIVVQYPLCPIKKNELNKKEFKINETFCDIPRYQNIYVILKIFFLIKKIKTNVFSKY